MTEYRFTSDTPGTITGQHPQNQPESTSTSNRSSATGSSTTRACARAREEARAAMLHGQYVDICTYYAQAFERAPAPGIQRELATRIRDGMSADVLRAAIDDTMMAPRPSWAYMAAILRRCDLENIKTIADWRQSKERYQASRNPALNYSQRTYTDDEYGPDFFLDLDKYFEEHGGDNK